MSTNTDPQWKLILAGCHPGDPSVTLCLQSHSRAQAFDVTDHGYDRTAPYFAECIGPEATKAWEDVLKAMSRFLAEITEHDDDWVEPEPEE